MRPTPPLLRLFFALGLMAVASSAVAEEWYDAYSRGLKALERHEAEKAILNLERAARLRPEPGTNVITYGTNWLDEYAPYLSLAEAYLLAGRPEQAREALKRSEGFAKEAANRWARLAVYVNAALALSQPAAAVVLPPSFASGQSLGRDVAVMLLLARSHLVEAQAALASAVERDRALAPLLETLTPRLSGSVRDLEKTLSGGSGGPPSDPHLPPVR